MANRLVLIRRLWRIFILSLGTANLNERVRAKYLIMIGMAVMVIGTLLLYGIISLSLTIGQMIIPMGVIGLGLGLIMAQPDNGPGCLDSGAIAASPAGALSTGRPLACHSGKPLGSR